MYSSLNRQYIFKQSSGKVWNFFYDEKSGLCYSILTRRNTWTEPVSLQKDIYRAFYMDIDYEDCFHILFLDKQGNIFYSKMDSENLKTLPVLSSKSVSLYNKHLSLIPQKNNIHLFFVLQYNNACILAHQILSDETVNNPKVIDYVNESDVPYTAVIDKSGSIYTFYSCSDGKYMQLGYKKYIPSRNYWSEFIPVTRFKGNVGYARVLVDEKNVIHACYQRHTGSQYELVYQQKIPDRNIWGDECIIHNSSYPYTESAIVLVEASIIVYWVREDIIYFSSSKDGGNEWSKPVRYGFPAGRQLLCVSYKTNLPQENEKLLSTSMPCIFINGFKLAFSGEAGENEAKFMSTDEFKNMILDGLKMIKISIEELKESEENLKENVASLAHALEVAEKEIAKYNVRVSLLEGELNKFKPDNYVKAFKEVQRKFDEIEKEILYLRHNINRERPALKDGEDRETENAVNANEMGDGSESHLLE